MFDILMLLGIVVGIVIFIDYLFGKARNQEDDFEHVRGVQLTIGSTQKPRGDVMILAGQEIPEDIIPRHFLIGGGPGSGKSQAIQDFVERILEKVEKEKIKAVITDSGGVFLSRFGSSHHLILNPFDARSKGWNPYSEIRDRLWDFDRIARSAIPDSQDHQSNTWHRYARNMLSDLMNSLDMERVHDPVRTKELICSSDTKMLASYLKGTGSEALVSEGNVEFFGSVQGVAAQFLRTWSFLDGEGTFSLRRWIRQEGPGVLWLTYRDDMMDSMRFLVSSWLDLLITEILSMEEAEGNTRFFFVMDEIDSLGMVPTLQNALSRGRKYGLSALGAIQSVAQLEQTYGEKVSQTLRSDFGSKLGLAQGSALDAEYWSREIGEAERIRPETSESENKGKNWHLLKPEVGSNSSGSGTSTNFKRQVEKVVLPSELQRLKPLTGYLMLAGDPEVRYVDFPYRELPRRFPAYVPKTFSGPKKDEFDLEKGEASAID